MKKDRIKNEIRALWYNNRKTDIILVAASFLVTIALLITINGLRCNPEDVSILEKANSATMLIGTFMALIMAVRSSMVFNELSNRSSQMRMMLFPSSMSEKYWARLAYMLAITIIACGMASDLAIGMWLLFQPHELTGKLYPVLFGLTTNIGDGMSMSPLLLLVGFVNWIAAYLAYTVGATYFRKHTFLYTSLVLCVACLLIILATGVLVGIYVATHEITRSLEDELTKSILNIYPVLDLLVMPFIIALLIFWSHRRFVRLQYKNK